MWPGGLGSVGSIRYQTATDRDTSVRTGSQLCGCSRLVPARAILAARWPCPVALKRAFCEGTGFLRVPGGSCFILAPLQRVLALRTLLWNGQAFPRLPKSRKRSAILNASLALIVRSASLW